MNPASEGVVLDIKVEVILKEKRKEVTAVERNVYLGILEPLQPLKEALDKGASEEGARTMNVEAARRGLTALHSITLCLKKPLKVFSYLVIKYWLFIESTSCLRVINHANVPF